MLREYKERKISVWDLNTLAFAMVNVDKSVLLETLKDRVKVRAGFHELVDYCRRKGFRFVIVSNGLDFYIRAILSDLGLENIEVRSAQACFRPEGGIDVRYVGPDGAMLEDGFKEAYVRLFLEQGYRVIYMGNGDSDLAPARHAHHVFATGELLRACREKNLNCQPLENFADAIRGMEAISQIQV